VVRLPAGRIMLVPPADWINMRQHVAATLTMVDKIMAQSFDPATIERRAKTPQRRGAVAPWRDP